MARPPLTVTLITLNEEKHITRAIQSVSWAEEVIVVDSGSTDQTVALAASLGARVIHHPWKGYGQQKNFAQQQATHDWVLNLDADEIVPPALAIEIQTKLEQLNSEPSDLLGFAIPRKTFYLGTWIRHGGWYPNYLVRCAHRKFACWTEPQVHETLKITGSIAYLNTALEHYAFSSIDEQIWTNLRFAKLGSEDLKRRGQRPSLFLLILKPVGKWIESYLLKRGFLDGLPGFIIAINAAHSMFLKYAYLTEDQIRGKDEDPGH